MQQPRAELELEQAQQRPRLPARPSCQGPVAAAHRARRLAAQHQVHLVRVRRLEFQEARPEHPARLVPLLAAPPR